MKHVFTGLICLLCCSLTSASIYGQSQDKLGNPAQDGRQIRQSWIALMDKIARPVFENLAAGQLKAKMPIAISPVSDNPKGRIPVQYLEAFGRALSGIAPWLQLEGGSKAEIKLRDQYRKWALKGIANATDSTQADYMVWKGGQPLVDASFFALGLIRCPWLWEHLDSTTKNNVVHCLLLTRATVPSYSNWVLFTGMIEAFFCKYDYPYDPVRIEYGIREFMEHWYVGDGMFSDGMHFHVDYYNSYVIQPYLHTIIDIISEKTGKYKNQKSELARIMARYSEIQERSIGADGSFPAFGRSIVYRSGAFQQLADMAFSETLSSKLTPAGVRGALNAVIQRTLTPPSTYDKNGWMVIGLDGDQPGLADVYNTQGSLYLCLDAFLPLGLSEDAAFWKDPYQPWTAKSIWSGKDHLGDHAVD